MDSGWFAVAAAFIAAGIAAWQAYEARKSRIEARSASDAAGTHEQAAIEAARSAAGAAERGAAAQERLAAVAEQTARGRKIWRYRYHGGENWQVYNESNEVINARLLPHDQERFLQLSEEAQMDHELVPGAGIDVVWPRRLSMPAIARVRVWWETEAGVPVTEVVTLDRSRTVPY